ncbi:DUF503 domain-containing protein [Bacillus fonticola]|uniref:DUF503 domain-containing protein n=1 Tax=Bacillus fonticola TaxID=2728853 RepID=UPI001472EEBB|nr:DUF503 family protein [Bacillus fonticola]
MILSLTVEVILYNAHSLKEKRAVLQRLFAHIGGQQNMAVSELDYQDLWQRAEFGVVAIASSKTVCEQMVQRVCNYLDQQHDLEATSIEQEWL